MSDILQANAEPAWRVWLIVTYQSGVRQMHLKSLYLRNFRCFDDATIDFDKNISVIIGDNATGKTTILSAIEKAVLTLYNIIPVPEYQSHFNTKTLELPVNSDDAITIHIETDIGTHTAIATKLPIYMSENEIFMSEKDSINGHCSLCSHVMQLVMRVRDNKNDAIPVFKIYSLQRTVFDNTLVVLPSNKEHPRLVTYSTSFDFQWKATEFSKWFFELEFDFLSKAHSDREYVSPILKAVKDAFELCLPEYENFRSELYNNKRILIMNERTTGKTIPIHLFSSGYLAILSVVADLACRMAMANPQMENPLLSQGIVLIDEIDLSLHPKWQQRVLADIQRAFPHVQFIVTTHSPLVLTTVHPENIIRLVRDGDTIRPEYGADMGISTYGADATRLMRSFMDVFPRPNKIKELLDSYFTLIHADAATSEQAQILRHTLEETIPGDPILQQADAMIEHRKRFA